MSEPVTLTVADTVSEEPSGDGSLALAQGKGMEALSHACVLCQLEQGTGGVHSWGQDEHKWGSRRGVLHHLEAGRHIRQKPQSPGREHEAGARRVRAAGH